MTLKKTGLFLLYGLFIIVQVEAQTVNYDRAALILRHPGKDVISLQDSETLELYFSDSSLKTKTVVTEEYFYVNKAPDRFHHRIYFSGFRTASDISVYTQNPGQKNYKKVKDLLLEQSFPYRDDVFFDDNYCYDIYCPGPEDGGFLKLSYISKSDEPYFIKPFYFNGHMEGENATYTVKYPKGVEVGYHLMGKNTGNIVFEKSTDDQGVTTLRWHLVQTEKIAYEEEGVGYSYYEPHIIVYVSSYTVNGKKVNVFNNTQGLYTWCNNFVKKATADSLSEVFAITDSIVAGEPDRLNQIKKVYYWVQDNIRYVSFEDGYGGYIPRKASLVMSKRYGDCKDLSNLMYQMLTHLGFNAHHTWVGTTSIPYDVDSVHVPYAFNHMILTVDYNDSLYFLDATSSFQPFGMPTSFIQGKKGMMGIDDSTYKIVPIPFIPYTRNMILDSLTLALENGNKLYSQNGKISLQGWPQINMSYRFSEKNSDLSRDIFSAYFQKGSNKFKLLQIKNSDLKDRENPLTINYAFELEDYVKKSGDEIILKLGLPTSYSYFQKIENRKTPLNLKSSVNCKDVYQLLIPEGYTVLSYPEEYSFESDNFGFSIRYQPENNHIIRHFSIYNNLPVLQKEDFEEWNRMCTELTKCLKKNIVLKKLP